MAVEQSYFFAGDSVNKFPLLTSCPKDDDYAPGEDSWNQTHQSYPVEPVEPQDLGTFALMNNGACRHNGKDEGKSALDEDLTVIFVSYQVF